MNLMRPAMYGAYHHITVCGKAAAPNATAERVRILSEKTHRPWYAPVARVGETITTW